MRIVRLLTYLFLATILTSCEKFSLEETSSNDEVENTSESDGNVTLHIKGADTDTYSRITCSFFSMGTKAKNVNQTNTATGFGEVKVKLAEGQYDLIMIAHNGEGNATVSSADKVTFYKNKVTDTFYYYGTLAVEGTDGEERTIESNRAVAKIRLHINDTIPETAKRIKFYYTGGSSTLDCTTGYGNVNSRQTEERDMSTTCKDYDIYTFPHSDGKKLHITITVYDQQGSVLATKELSDVEVKRNYITTCSTSLFNGTSSGGGTTGTDTEFKFDPTWEGHIEVEF